MQLSAAESEPVCLRSEEVIETLHRRAVCAQAVRLVKLETRVSIKEHNDNKSKK